MSRSSIEDSWIARYLAVAVLSVVGAKLTGDAATAISGTEGAFAISASGALAGFLIVFLFSWKLVSSLQDAAISDFGIDFGGRPPLPVPQLDCFYQLRDGKDLTKEWTTEKPCAIDKTPNGINIHFRGLSPGTLIRVRLADKSGATVWESMEDVRVGVGAIPGQAVNG
jgi:hypothetical protein